MNRIPLIFRQKIFSIIFIIISLAGGIIIFFYIGSLKEKIPENISYNQIFIAKADIKKNREITGEHIESKRIPADIFSGKFVVNKNEIIGKKVTADILKGEIITEDKIEGKVSDNDFSYSFSYHIPDGMRAVSVPVSFYGDRTLIKEGDKVDLISTYYTPETGELHSETVLSEKEIILIDKNQRQSDSENKGESENFILGSVTGENFISSYNKNYLIITFYLTCSEAEEIFRAIEMGVVNLSICHGN